MKTPLLILSCLWLTHCQSQVSSESDAQSALSPVPDSVYADVFKPWDGRWQGTFTVYRHTEGQQAEPVQPRDLDEAYFATLPLQEELVIQVEQVYQSESPYYQTVHIRDTYPQEDGSLQTVESQGYNQVKNGQLICVVNKPDEKVVHQGSVPEAGTIIWERNLPDPLKIEYFYEWIKADTYFILGWGYYGSDDPTKSPKTWFRAAYKRVE